MRLYHRKGRRQPAPSQLSIPGQPPASARSNAPAADCQPETASVGAPLLTPEFHGPGHRHSGAAMGWLATLMLAGAAGGVLLWLEIRRYTHFGADAYDYGIFEQTVWLIAHGHRPFVTVRGMFILGDHFSLILYPIAWLRWLFPSPYLLFVVQCLSFGAGAIPLYRLALRRTGHPSLSCLLVASYLLHPSVWGMAAFDYHPETLAVPLLLAALDAIDAREWARLVLWCALALVCKESLAPAVFMIGLLAAWRGSRRNGALIAAASVAWFFIATGAMAHFAGRHSSAYWSLYGPILQAAHKGPGALLSTVWLAISSPGSIGYLVGLMSPLAFLCLLAPEVSAVIVPAILGGVLSLIAPMHTIGYQYDAVPLPVLYAAAAVGLGRALRLSHLSSADPFHVQMLLAALLLYGSLASTLNSTWPRAQAFYTAGVSSRLSARREALLKQIPPAASATAPSDIVARIADRTHVYMFPNPAQECCWGASVAALRQQRGKDFTPFGPAQFQADLAASGVEYVILALDDAYHYPISTSAYHQLAAATLTCPTFGVVATAGGLALLRRGAPFRQGLSLVGLDPHTPPGAMQRQVAQDWDTLIGGRS